MNANDTNVPILYDELHCVHCFSVSLAGIHNYGRITPEKELQERKKSGKKNERDMSGKTNLNTKIKHNMLNCVRMLCRFLFLF